jgi:HSP20 family protein
MRELIALKSRLACREGVITSREEGTNFFAYERSYGSFTRSFTLPEAADLDHVKAELKDGVLTLVLPKKPEMQPKRIQVNAVTGEKQKS